MPVTFLLPLLLTSPAFKMQAIMQHRDTLSTHLFILVTICLLIGFWICAINAISNIASFDMFFASFNTTQ
jgi:hypothetical protein